MTNQLTSSEAREQAIALRRAGKSRREIKEILGVGNSTLDPALRGEPPPLWTARPRAKDYRHAKARELRAAGATYKEIATQLGVSKSSVSLWVRDMPRTGRLSAEAIGQQKAERLSQYREARQLRRAEHRQGLREAAAAQIGELSSREVLIAGAIAYWCEGCKSKPYQRRDQISFVNSDPELIRFFLHFMASVGVTSDRFICRLLIHESADVAGALRFWQQLTCLPAEQFRKPTLKRHNPKTVRKNTGAHYHGCLAVNVRRSAELYRQVEAWATAAMAS